MRESYRLPSRRDTRSATRYLREWRALGRSVTGMLGGRLVAFDPDLLLEFEDGQTVQIPAWIAVRLMEWKGRHDDALEVVRSVWSLFERGDLDARGTVEAARERIRAEVERKA